MPDTRKAWWMAAWGAAPMLREDDAQRREDRLREERAAEARRKDVCVQTASFTEKYGRRTHDIDVERL